MVPGKDGSLKRSSNYCTLCETAYGRNNLVMPGKYYKLNQKVYLYKKPNAKKVRFTVRKGTKVKLSKVYLQQGGLCKSYDKKRKVRLAQSLHANEKQSIPKDDLLEVFAWNVKRSLLHSCADWSEKETCLYHQIVELIGEGYKNCPAACTYRKYRHTI